MPSSENLFTLDPLKTSLTKPTTDVKVQGPANRSVENSQLLQGLKTFGNAVGSLAKVKKEQQITADMRLAQNAALRGEAEPSGLFGVASEEFERVVEANVITKTIRDMNQFLDGESGSNLVNAGGAYSENVAAADKFFDTLYDQGKNFSLNPRMLDLFNQKVEEQRNKTKLEIALVNRDRNRSQVIQRIGNAIEDTVDFSKDIYSGGVESDSSDIEGTDEYPILFSLDSNITPELHNTLSSDTVALNMGIELPEAKRLVLQMFLQNETVIAQPSLADKLMASEYSPGVTYEALYIKGLLASNTDKDAADIVKMRNIQLQASFDHHKALNAQDKAEAEARTKFGKSAVTQILSENGSNENAYATGAQYGLSEGEVNTLVTAHNKFKGNLKHGINTPQGRALKREIEDGQHLNEEDITLALFERGLKDDAIFKALVSREKTQTKSAQKAYDSEIKLIKEKTFQLLKGSLKNNKAITRDENGDMQFDEVAFANQALGGIQGLDPNEIQDVISRLQILQNDYEYRSNEAAREVARSDTFDRANVTKFGDDYNKAVSLFISDLEKNIISKTQVRDARKKEETNKKAAEASAIAGAKLKEPRVIPTATVKEEIEIKKQILTDPTTHIKNEIDIIKDAYKSLFSTDPKASPKSGEAAKEKSISDRPISESEQVYLKRLEQAVPTSPPEESVSTTGLGSFADNIDANFNALPGIINDMQREQVFLKGLNLFFEGAVSDFKESFSTGDQSAEVPAGGGSEEQLVGKGLSEPMSDEDRSRLLADNARNIEEPFATLNLRKGSPPEVGGPIAAGTKSRKNDGGIAGPDIRETVVKPETAKGVDVSTNQEKTTDSLNKYFGNNHKMKSVLLATIQDENDSFDPTRTNSRGDGGVGLIQFTGPQKVSFEKWLKDKNKTMDHDSTVEYISELLTANKKWAKKYHEVGSGHLKKLRELSNTGTIEELSDYFTDNIIKPGDNKGAARKNDIAQRSKLAKEFYNNYKGN